MLLFIASLFLFDQFVFSQEIVTLLTDQSIIMYNGAINSEFVLKVNNFDCSAYVYSYAQSQGQYQSNTPISFTINNLIDPTPLSVSTLYGSFVPTLNQSVCAPTGCTVMIYHNCANDLNNQNYFDIVQIHIQSVGLFSYNLECNSSFNPIYFEWGQFIISLSATVVLLCASIFAALESFNGNGIEYSIRWIILVASIQFTLGMLTLFVPQVSSIILDVLSWILGTIAVGIVTLEILYVFVRRTCCNSMEVQIGPIRIRLVDVISFVCGLGVVIGWWFSSKNWIISDIISVSIVISIIKIFKFVSFKTALASFFIILFIYILGGILTFVFQGENYSTYFLFRVNSPFQFQIPVISHTFANNCAWISITSIAFPGLMVSYLHRFDKSRSTRIYIITTISSYFIASIIWNTVSAVSNVPIPFDAIVEPIMILTFSLMALNRKELRTIWEGTFYDEEFVNKGQIQMLGEAFSKQAPSNLDMLRSSIPDNLFLDIQGYNLNENTEDPIRRELFPNDQL